MKKKISALLCAAALTTTAYAQDVKVYINDSPVEFNQRPVIYQDMTFVPFRTIFEKLGMMVQWQDSEKRATAIGQNRQISFIMDYDYIFFGDIGYPIPQGPIIVNSRMLVPLRALAEGINGDVYWDENTYSVKIYTNDIIDDSDWTYQILYLTNQIRAEYGLGSLEWDEELAEVGREHCIDMAAREYFDHSSPDGSSPFDRMVKAGIRFSLAGENIAAGQSDPQDVVDAWMNSPGHRANILEPDFTRLGTAFYRGGNMGIYWAQEFAG